MFQWFDSGNRLWADERSMRVFLVLFFFISGFAQSYESSIHQQITFLAAKQYSKCAESDKEMYQPSALDVRYLVRANVAQADAGFFSRSFRWNYYNQTGEEGREFLWVIETRLHQHYRNLLVDVDSEKPVEERLRSLGKVLSYLQDVTSPSRVVPVYTGRWWRFSFSDRFDRFPMNIGAVEARLDGSCSKITLRKDSFSSLLAETADQTIEAIKTKIDGYPVSWEAFWSFARNQGDFGEYGPAGNQFGKRSAFNCGEEEQCLLLEGDPLYQEFALERHVQAVEVTMQVLMMMQNNFSRNAE